MNRAWLCGAALLLPLAGFGYTWATTHAAAQLGEEWLIPIKGYDPLDMLRGHFIQYRYDWPHSIEAATKGDSPVVDMWAANTQSICIQGRAPNIQRAWPWSDVYVSVRGPMGVYEPNKPMVKRDECAIIARATLGTRREVRGLDTGILYVSEDKASDYQKRLSDPKIQSFVRAKIRPDGVMRPIGMEFFPRAR